MYVAKLVQRLQTSSNPKVSPFQRPPLGMVDAVMDVYTLLIVSTNVMVINTATITQMKQDVEVSQQGCSERYGRQ